ncbi:MAG: hypothetical protein COV29_04430 [Candidatus Yanofskybacteria bacterium CG10_big_fil_rev_8_21_14_0_10_36_16]|uniref:Bacterial type II secretion system protein E domain-containing protein n=1 Tax=Candidatus Yanofskybacteria bacterium CG10_big_fil_rev_8_21_14_0_10_36_16 TaxID=1975096 RepID=A0A2J0Q6S1_9BACT|nr:MAG: hypothetical protein COV29_04430 [Candidatus Yanofskybacteria bacterium CG10_big_fil_rev_8_21_14_0_10_36_16]
MPSIPQKDTRNTELEKELDKKMSEIEVDREKEEAQALAQKVGLPFVNLTGFPIDVSALSIIPEEEAQRGRIAIVSKDGNNLKVVTENPDNPETKKILESLESKGYSYALAVVSINDFNKVLKRYKEVKQKKRVQLGVVGIPEEEVSELQKEIQSISDLKEKLGSMSISKVLNILLAGALKTQASDIHFETEEKGIRLRYRVDGLLINVVETKKEGYEKLLSRIKLMSGLKININSKPQDGRFTIRQGKLDIEIRVSVIPSEYGESIVMRVLDPRVIKQHLEELGMRDETLTTVKRLLKKITGAIATTGPTGSGKTTTLYAFLRHVNAPEIKIITIEDPIEYHIESVTQTQVDPASGYTFSNGLRSIVRQDPDVILVGEIRDVETAEIAMQASLTGHQVFTTLHTNDASGAIPRLIDLGVKPITIAPALNASMAQRLVRRLCDNCKVKQKLSINDYKKIEFEFSKVSEVSRDQLPELNQSIEIYYPAKCKECHDTGYRGRMGIFEIFEIDTELEKLIQTSPAISDIRDLAIKKGMVTMVQDGMIKALKGLTSMEEVMRVTGDTQIPLEIK